MVWSRLLPKPSHIRLLSRSLITPRPHNSTSSTFLLLSRPFSTNDDDNNNNNKRDQPGYNIWQLSGENEGNFDSFFPQDSDTGVPGITDSPVTAKGEDEESWLKEDENGDDGGRYIFDRLEKDVINERSVSDIGGGGGEWRTSSLGVKQWSFEEEEKEDKVFDFGEGVVRSGEGNINWGENVPSERSAEEEKMLEKEKEELNAVLKGKQASSPFHLFSLLWMNEWLYRLEVVTGFFWESIDRAGFNE